MQSYRFLAVVPLMAASCFAQPTPKPGTSGFTGLGPTGYSSRLPVAAHSGAGRGGYGGYGRRIVAAPLYYGVPVYGGYGYGPDYGYGSDYSSYGPSPDPAPPQAAPTVIINQNFVPDHANPSVQEVPDSSNQMGAYQAPGPPPVEPSDAAALSQKDQPTIYLIAFLDHSIVPALAYWTEGNTLKYVNMDHSINQATLDLVDRRMSRLLNQQRNVDFRLPAR